MRRLHSVPGRRPANPARWPLLALLSPFVLVAAVIAYAALALAAIAGGMAAALDWVLDVAGGEPPTGQPGSRAEPQPSSRADTGDRLSDCLAPTNVLALHDYRHSADAEAMSSGKGGGFTGDAA